MSILDKLLDKYAPNGVELKHILSLCKINPKSVIIDKIFKGDLSDNIFAIILRTSKSKSDKKFKISTKDIDYSLNIDDDNKIREFIHNLLNSKNYMNRIYGNKTENAGDIFLEENMQIYRI